MLHSDIYSYVTTERNAYTKPISLTDGWSWSMKEHLRRSYLYKNSQFELNNEDRDKRPFKNIIRPILNAQYRTEGFDVKDIELYVNDSVNYFKSFLVKKFHDKWARDNALDSFIDDLVESYVDYGGVLVKNIDDIRPEVVDLQTIAFCDQSNILAGPFAIEHNFSPQQLKGMASVGWGDASKGATIHLDTLIAISEAQEKREYQINKTPGKKIQVYEIHGEFPEHWLGKEDADHYKYIPQIQVIAFYKNQEDKEIGVTLLRLKEPKLPFKYLARDKVSFRALGFGGIEELFEAQVWTNSNEVDVQEMLALASKVFYKTTDPAFKTRNNIRNADTGEIFTLQEGRDIGILDTTPRNTTIFNNAIAEWERHAQQMGAAGETLLGEAPTAGTPFKLFEARNIEEKGLHRWRQGKIAVFVDELYREWVLPYFSREIVKEQNFLAELSANEMMAVADSLVENQANKFVLERILSGELVFPEEIEAFKTKTRESFARGGNKKFIKILKDELKNLPIEISTNIAGKQKNLALLTDKVVNVLRQFIATPQIRQDPEMVKLLNTILESSGLSPIMFGTTGTAPTPPSGATEPLKELGAITKTVQPALAV